MRPALVLAVLALIIGGIYATWTQTRNRGDHSAQPSGQAEPANRLGNLARITPPTPAPALTITDQAGKPHSLKDFAGKLILVNFWATWCGPCREEMPSLDRLQAKLGGERFQVVPISLDRGGTDRVLAFLKDNGIGHLTTYFDAASKSLALFTLPGLPTSVLIDAKGRQVARLIGPAQWDSPEAVALIESLQGVGAPPP